MTARLGEIKHIIRHYGGLGIFFALYLSTCYAITSYMLIKVPYTSFTDEPLREPMTVVQVSSAVETKSVTVTALHHTKFQQGASSTSSIYPENIVHSSSPPQTSSAHPQGTPSSQTETPSEPAPGSLADALQKHQAIKRLLDSL